MGSCVTDDPSVFQSYRAENFETAAKVYKALSEHPELGNESNDLRINTWATEAQAVWKRRAAWLQPRRPTREDLEAFETAYNAACLSLARGDFRQGEVLLKRAKGAYSTLPDICESCHVDSCYRIVQDFRVPVSRGKDCRVASDHGARDLRAHHARKIRPSGGTCKRNIRRRVSSNPPFLSTPWLIHVLQDLGAFDEDNRKK